RFEAFTVFEVGTFNHLAELVVTDLAGAHGIEDNIAGLGKEGTDENIHIFEFGALLQNAYESIEYHRDHDNLDEHEAQVLEEIEGLVIRIMEQQVLDKI